MIQKVKGVDVVNEKVKDKLVFDLNSDQGKYMQNLEKIYKDKEIVYGEDWEQYSQILDYKESLSNNQNNNNLDQAYSDYQFIRQKREEHIKETKQKENIEYQKKIEEQERIEYINEFYGNCQKNQFQPLPRQRIQEREKRALSLNAKNSNSPSHNHPNPDQILSNTNQSSQEIIKDYQDEVYLVKPKSYLKSKIKMKFYLKE